MVSVAAIGDVMDINCWSNIPYYFYKTGERLDLFQHPFRLNLSDFSFDQKIWNLKQLIKKGSTGGYQWSEDFLTKAESSIQIEYYLGKVISLNQVFPRAKTIISKGGKAYYYIDTTLNDLFNDPSYGVHLSKETKRKVLALEKENYQLAEKVVSMGSWVKKSLMEDYHISEDKISNILPGANLILPEDYSPPQWKSGAGITREFIFGFIGKDWERKGLPFLISIKNSLKDKGYKIKIKVIGSVPKKFEIDPDIDFLGFIDKSLEIDKIIKELSSCDIGCLFSKGEALGISTLEFIRVGIPVTGFYHQGLQDTLFEDASIRIGIDDDFDSVVKKFEDYINNPMHQHKLWEGAKIYSTLVGWENCIMKWKSILKESNVTP